MEGESARERAHCVPPVLEMQKHPQAEKRSVLLVIAVPISVTKNPPSSMFCPSCPYLASAWMHPSSAKIFEPYSRFEYLSPIRVLR
jgi:hypothetical protein